MDNQNKSLSLDQLMDKKSALTEKMKELQANISKYGITKNQMRYKPHTVNKYALVERDKLVFEYNNLQKEVIDINTNIRRVSERPDYFREVVKNSFPEEVYQEIISESKKRELGHAPSRIKCDVSEMSQYKNLFYQYKKELLDQYESLMAARRSMTKFIDDNCPVDLRAKEIFLKSVSPINMSLPTIDTLQKKRRVMGY